MAGHLRRRATTLATALGREVAFDEAAAALASGFVQALNLTLDAGKLSAFERTRTGELRTEKYASEAWALRL